jgi:hypothetical protein
MTDIKFCHGNFEHINVTEVDSKVWHDDDMYEVYCTKCGAREKQLSRRPTDCLIRCEKGDE